MDELFLWAEIVRHAFDKDYLSSIGRNFANNMRLIQIIDNTNLRVLVNTEHFIDEMYIHVVETYGPALLKSASEIIGGNVNMTFTPGRIARTIGWE